MQNRKLKVKGFVNRRHCTNKQRPLPFLCKTPHYLTLVIQFALAMPLNCVAVHFKDGAVVDCKQFSRDDYVISHYAIFSFVWKDYVSKDGRQTISDLQYSSSLDICCVKSKQKVFALF